MATLVYRMNLSLDGFVDHTEMPSGPAVFRHWTEQVAGLAGSIYGRRIYDLMRYWDEDDPGWGEAEHAFAAAWRRQPKWVASRTLTSVGPNATLVAEDLETAVRDLKARHAGEISVAGTELGRSLADLGLIDAYQLYYVPAVLGRGTPFFAGFRPRLRFVASDPVGDGVVRLSYVPA